MFGELYVIEAVVRESCFVTVQLYLLIFTAIEVSKYVRSRIRPDDYTNHMLINRAASNVAV